MSVSPLLSAVVAPLVDDVACPSSPSCGASSPSSSSSSSQSSPSSSSSESSSSSSADSSGSSGEETSLACLVDLITTARETALYDEPLPAVVESITSEYVVLRCPLVDRAIRVLPSECHTHFFNARELMLGDPVRVIPFEILDQPNYVYGVQPHIDKEKQALCRKDWEERVGTVTSITANRGCITVVDTGSTAEETERLVDFVIPLGLSSYLCNSGLSVNDSVRFRYEKATRSVIWVANSVQRPVLLRNSISPHVFAIAQQPLPPATDSDDVLRRKYDLLVDRHMNTLFQLERRVDIAACQAKIGILQNVAKGFMTEMYTHQRLTKDEYITGRISNLVQLTKLRWLLYATVTDQASIMRCIDTDNELIKDLTEIAKLTDTAYNTLFEMHRKELGKFQF